MSDQTACGCTKVKYDPFELKNGMKIQRWRCVECHRVFEPKKPKATCEVLIRYKNSAHGFLEEFGVELSGVDITNYVDSVEMCPGQPTRLPYAKVTLTTDLIVLEREIKE